MIEYIKGQIAELTPAMAVIDCQGIGYGVNISLNTFSAIQGKESCKLFIYEAIREDAHVLYGFISKKEREIFLNLISVSGIGGNTARMILSALSTSELINVIATENVSILKSVKGIGAKTAQRIIVELKDKIGSSDLGVDMSGVKVSAIDQQAKQTQEEAVAALSVLGFIPAQSQKVVTAILKDIPNATLEVIVKEALKRL